MNGPIAIERLAGLDQIDATTWNAAARCGHTATVFQTLQWHHAWWEVFGEGHELLLLAAHRDGAFVGALALYYGADRSVRFVGHGRSDYLDVVGAADAEVRSELWQSALSACPSWRRLDVRYLPSHSPTVQDLADLGFPCLHLETVPCPTLLVRRPADADAVLRKKSLRRHRAWFLKQPNPVVEHLTTAAEIEPHLDTFFVQHVRRWEQTAHRSLFDDERNRQFYRAATRHLDGTGWLCFTRLTTEGRCVAGHFGLRFGGRLLWYKPSFDVDFARHSPGEAMMAELVLLVQREQLQELDFTVGREAFKDRFANHVRQNICMIVFHSAFDHLRSAVLRKAKHMVKTVLGR